MTNHLSEKKHVQYTISSGWTFEQLSAGKLWRDDKGRPRAYIGRIKDKYGIWTREYRKHILIKYEEIE